jgi:hypothetical protein
VFSRFAWMSAYLRYSEKAPSGLSRLSPNLTARPRYRSALRESAHPEVLCCRTCFDEKDRSVSPRRAS